MSNQPERAPEYCLVCDGEITMSMCQQSQFIDGVSYPLHVGCFDQWAEEEIEVWTVTAEDYGYTTDRESVLAEIDNLEDDQELTVRKWKMPRLKYLTLPEANI